MSNNQNTPCGCRCNSANDTRPVNLKPASVEHASEVVICRLGEIVDLLTRMAPHPAVIMRSGDDFRIDGVEYDGNTGRPKEFRSTELEVDGVVAPQPSGDSLDDDVPFVFIDRVRECVAADDELVVHSSPVVAESEADTSDAPAMTVQEGGGSTAAPGVEGPFSPVPSTPRFVAVSDRVYDRDANKVAACVSLGAARSVAAELNTGNGHIANFYWEDAK